MSSKSSQVCSSIWSRESSINRPRPSALFGSGQTPPQAGEPGLRGLRTVELGDDDIRDDEVGIEVTSVTADEPAGRSRTSTEPPVVGPAACRLTGAGCFCSSARRSAARRLTATKPTMTRAARKMPPTTYQRVKGSTGTS